MHNLPKKKDELRDKRKQKQMNFVKGPFSFKIFSKNLFIFN